MKLSTKIVLGMSAIVVFAMACVISWSSGYNSGLQAGGVTSSMVGMMDLWHAASNVTDRTSNASCEGAKEAINEYLSILENYKDNKRVMHGTLYYADVMLGHIRLARIERQLGNHNEATKHLAIAKDACSHRKWPECSEEKMIMFARRLEEKGPIACLANEK